MASVLIAEPPNTTDRPQRSDVSAGDRVTRQSAALAALGGVSGFAPLRVTGASPSPRPSSAPLARVLEPVASSPADAAPIGSPTADRPLSLPLGAGPPDPSVGPGVRGEGDGASGFRERYVVPTPTPRPTPRPTPQPTARPEPARVTTPASGPSSSSSGGGWRWTGASWYGPGFYGNGTACGQTYSRTILGIAHRTLPCGTRVQLRWKGRVITVPVIDRGPYGVAGRDIDMSVGVCKLLVRCYTAPIEFRIP